MTQDQPMMDVGHETTIEGTVNPDAPLVDLFNDRGMKIAVAEADVTYWLQQGFSREAIDPEAEFAGLSLIADAAMTAIGEAVRGVTADGKIDTADTAAMFTAERGIAEFVDHAQRVMRALSARYPNIEPAGIHMTNADGTRSGEVDPGSVDEFLADGWTRTEEN